MNYPFADRAAEDERLVRQGRLFDPFTRRVLEEAGLAPGMRVLDLGSGAGNVARLAAELVGPDGAVVGIERDPAAIELARRRTGVPNVEYRPGDVQTLDGVEDGFDAVIGRLVLMYLPDAAAALRRAASLVRPGGLVCVQEADMAYDWASPRPPLWDRIRTYFLTTLDKAGVEPRMGPALYPLFRTAGLPGPSMLCETLIEGGPDAPAWGWANTLIGALPAMESLGVVTRNELDPETLADRLLAEIRAAGGSVIAPPMTGAWITVPPA